VTFLEGDLDNNKGSKDELGDHWQALLVDTDKPDELDGLYLDSFFTLVKNLLAKPVPLTNIANTLVDDLTSLSLLH
jgi:hypothetical protein